MRHPGSNAPVGVFVEIKNHGTLMCRFNEKDRMVEIVLGGIVTLICFDADWYICDIK